MTDRDKMQPYELDAFLGEFADELDTETKTDLLRVSVAAQARYPAEVDDDGQPIEAEGEGARYAFSAAVECAFGQSDLASLAAAYSAARVAEWEAKARLVGGIIWADEHDRLSQLAITNTTGLNRRTVRRALGL